MEKVKLKILKMNEEDIDYEGDIALFPGAEGQFAVMPGHTRFATPLKKGEISVRNKGEKQTFEVESGFLVVTKEDVRVLLG